MREECPLCGRPIPKGAAYCPHDGTPIDDGRPSLRAPAPRETKKTGVVLDGRYRVGGFVDKGATARVYVAEDLVEKRNVAVKIFDPVVHARDEMRERFLREADAARRIDHPHVVRVFGAGITRDDAPYVVMEHLHGAPLGGVLRRTGRLPLDVASRIVREAAAGLAAAHAAGVVHRDVKPDNVFLVSTGQAESDPARASVKLIDFGMAKVDRAPTSRMRGLVIGTVEYMAPEQIVGEEVDARTDVYALGVVLYRTLTGHLPFDVRLGTDLLGHQLFSPAPPPTWLEEGIGEGLERVILSAIRKRPDNRYSSMEAFAEDLARATEGGSPTGAPMVVSPDRYEPTTDLGRDAMKFLAAQFFGHRV